MTYNVHSCVGTDGRHSPKRIARVIGRYQPDIVALQELDIGRKRTGEADQPHLIARELEMLYHFHPSIEVAEERYGNAILSRYPIELVRAMKLPKLESRLNLEPRGAVWVTVKVGNVNLQIINAHLSFYGPECRHQAKALIGPEWLTHPRCAGPVVLCGDFNALPNTNPWRTISGKLRDAQRALEAHRPLATWFGRYPIGRIDHVFVGPGIRVLAVDVPKTQLNKLASDHLPLIVDLEVT
ncbi:MAG: endonuclease/exonuclease/phosphatase family protein [Candidatus Omnitrophica bacterium]|nr:endonuclease/exonuclease/phosphatase family protein [Candidatus Omnitrophota bacterium]